MREFIFHLLPNYPQNGVRGVLVCTVDCGSTGEGSIPSVRPKSPSKSKQTRRLSVEQEEASASLADGAKFTFRCWIKSNKHGGKALPEYNISGSARIGGSKMAMPPTVNRKIAGSNPARTAVLKE